ncbi:hypothetical protein HDU98_011081 [Podochytrium sp. JEL0797]|nr:hypothetical protein HDU98_011081 [Podochytrium sp. JEL0797]
MEIHAGNLLPSNHAGVLRPPTTLSASKTVSSTNLHTPPIVATVARPESLQPKETLDQFSGFTIDRNGTKPLDRPEKVPAVVYTRPSSHPIPIGPADTTGTKRKRDSLDAGHGLANDHAAGHGGGGYSRVNKIVVTSSLDVTPRDRHPVDAAFPLGSGIYDGGQFMMQQMAGMQNFGVQGGYGQQDYQQYQQYQQHVEYQQHQYAQYAAAAAAYGFQNGDVYAPGTQ